MKPTSDEIRTTFLNFFRERGHEVVPSSGVIPRNDPTLLFTNAGMVQFKDAFLGVDRPGYTRAASSQKCIRMSGKHNDLENVGRTARHHTFFEMLGNFSFGDYFKREAIAFAWELLTKVWAIPPHRLVITVFGGEDGLPADDEARAIWREVTGFPEARIIGMGKKDNFWTMGDTGPCGPCTEVHYWLGSDTPDLGRFDQEPTADGTGWMEIWNLVFMQFNRAEKNGPLTPLPAPCVDTGMGLERITAVLQGVTSNYETDLLRPLVDRAAEILGRPYTQSDADADVACRVIADHARMTAMALAEGITPSNKDRGASLRSVMRRAIRHEYMQGVATPRFDEVVALVCERMAAAYPELRQHRDFIIAQAHEEDRRFRETIPAGLALLDAFTGWETGSAGQRILPGAVAFDLHATHGFPLDLTVLLGQERGFGIDMEGYEAAKKQHAAVSRGDAEAEGVSKEKRVRPEHREALAKVGSVRFTGYEGESGQAPIAALLVGAPGDRNWSFATTLAAGAHGQVVTAETPFYGEAGGQVGDRGTITTPTGTFVVHDTQKPAPGLVVHHGEVTRGAIAVGELATLTVDAASRAATRRNHSATHLLHWALRKVLGPHAQQKGSKVGPEGLRFDYASVRALSAEEIARIEDLVNDEVLANDAVQTEVTSQAEARARGAMMIFEEKYGDEVRLLRIGRESVELCGGTHARRTGDLGLFKVVSDTNVGAGVRRVEAVTGTGALALVRAQAATIQQVADALKAPVAEVAARTEKALEHQRELARQVEELKRQLTTGGAGGGAEVREVGDAKVIVARAPVGEEKAMREYADHLRDKHGRAVAVLGAVTPEGKALLVVAVSKDLTSRFHAGKIVGELAAVVGGRGGGRPDMAGAGGPEAAKLDEALARAWSLLS